MGLDFEEGEVEAAGDAGGANDAVVGVFLWGGEVGLEFFSGRG